MLWKSDIQYHFDSFPGLLILQGKEVICLLFYWFLDLYMRKELECENIYNVWTKNTDVLQNVNGNYALNPNL